MIVSYTELKDILDKVFEGLGFPLGDYEDCARDVAWMELHGWSVLAEILDTHPMPQSQAAHFLYDDDSLSVIDAQYNGGLIYGSLALDLAVVKAEKQPTAVVQLINARHPKLIIPSLPRCAEQGLNVLVTWQEAAQNIIGSIGSGEKYPTVRAYSNETAAPDGSVTIVCGTAVAFSPSSTITPIQIITPTIFEDYYNNHIDQGIPVKDSQWQQLVKLSKNILVEATASSRRKGAGEDA